jgi:hypothetical protein
MRILLRLASIIGSVALSLGFVNSEDNPIIYSSENKLQWANFKSPVPDTAEFSAVTIANFSITTQVNHVRKTGNVEIIAFMEPDKSYVKIGKQTDYLLNHEQRHFDIAELHARKLRKEIASFKYSSSVEDSIIRVYHEVHSEYRQFQLSYDEETEHSGNKNKQHEWDMRIDSLLNIYSDFADRKVKLF